MTKSKNRLKRVKIGASFLEAFLTMRTDLPVETFIVNPLPSGAELVDGYIEWDDLILTFSHPSFEPVKPDDMPPFWEVKFRQERKEDECKAQTTCTNQTTGGTTNGAETADTSETV